MGKARLGWLRRRPSNSALSVSKYHLYVFLNLSYSDYHIPEPERLFKGQKTVLSTITRPLGDKTPLPNRLANTLFQTPLPRINKPSKLNDDGGKEEGGTPDSIQRPSSMRKHLKQPRNSGKKFETPVNNGNHWDVSDGDIVLLDAQAVPEPIVEGEDDLDEVEYGAPNTLGMSLHKFYLFIMLIYGM
jgi:hypothetical protein